MEFVSAKPGSQTIGYRARGCSPDRSAACQILVATVAAAFGVAVNDLHAPTRMPAQIAFARQVAMYLVHVELGMSLTEVGRHFSRDRTTAAHACRVVEERSEAQEVDRILNCIRNTFHGWRKNIEHNKDGSNGQS